MFRSQKHNFGTLIRRLREEKGVSMRELAKSIGVTYGYIGNIERGEESAREDRIQSLAAALDYDPDELLAVAGKIAPDIVKIYLSNPKKIAALLRAQV